MLTAFSTVKIMDSCQKPADECHLQMNPVENNNHDYWCRYVRKQFFYFFIILIFTCLTSYSVKYELLNKDISQDKKYYQDILNRNAFN